MIRKWLMMSLAVATYLSAFASPEIQLVADGASGEYCGVGYGITVNVSTPASGYTVKYSESAEGPWVDELKYVNVCADKPIYYQVTATGYATKTGSANVTVTPKELTEDIIWLVFPSEDYVYDGTAKEPDVAAADGDPSIITDDDWEVSFTDNVNAGTATATFTGKGNYFGECTEEFEILKADNEWTTEPAVANWTYGQTASEPVSAAKDGTAAVTWSSGSKPTLPGDYTATFTVPESANYNALTQTVDFKVLPATINLVADGASGEYCGVGYGITVNVSTPSSGYTIKYAESADGPWVDELKYVNVCTDKPIYYQVTAEGYTTATGSANVTVTPKELTEDIIWLVLPTEDYVYDGTAKEPDVAAADGDPSIITDGDWEVSFADNVDAGTATATFTGKGNYTGTCTEEFEIAKADNSWTTEPAVADWTYGQAASTPVSAAQVGSATVTWSSGSVPTLPGSYTATFTVPESANYNELTKTVNFKVLPATINLVADGATGEYCGIGYGITVNVSKPASGYTVKYAESAEGPWVDELKYVNVCADKPIYYQVTAEGYTTATGSANVTVTPKELTNDSIWLVLPAEDYVYDGTAKEPDVAAADGDPSIITDNDWEVSFADNVNAGTATATFTGKGNYTGTCTEEFEIAKADNAWMTEPAVADWTYGQTASTPVSAAQVGSVTVTWSSGSVPTLPGSYTATFTVPESDNYNELTKTVNFKVLPATINLVADGATGEYCGVGYGITVNVSKPASGYTVKYAESAEGPWVDELKYVNVCAEKPIYYQVTAEGYTTATGSANVTVTPKELTNDSIWLVLPAEDYVYDGTAKEPDVAAADGDPSIITDGDWEVSFTDNVDAGTATATFTGKGNYTGTCTEEFEIARADNSWTTEPAVADWTYGQTASTPVSAAQVGTATVTWSSGSVPTLPGSYTATFTVPESDNYNELTKTVNFKVLPATINLVADGATGEYCGVGYGITVNVSKPASGYTVKYAESAEGPWVDELKYVNVCADKPIYYQVTAEGYTTATGSANVTITPKTLTNDSIWLVFPSEDYVYDGTAKEPDVAAADGDPSIITDGDWEVSFTDNVNAGTATATFTGKGNYTGTCTEEFEIAKADNAWMTEPAVADWTYGQTASTPVSAAQVGSATVTWSSGSVPTLPGSYTATFTVPESDNYNELTKTVNFKVLPATINLVADGATGEYCGVGYGITVNVSKPASGYTVKYAESADGPWVDELKYVNVCADKPIYYQVTAEGYTTATGSANVTVTPKELTEDIIWLVLPTEDYVYDGTAKEPEVAAFDGEPSIITDGDWEVSFADNVNAGTATATFTGKGNYTGTCTEEFEIAKADNAWMTEPAVADWTYGQPASTPVSAAQVGTATVTWSSGSVPTLPGSYTATFTVAESENYNELTKTVNFKVLPATINLVVDGASGEYCGVGYGITVNVSTPASGYTVKYAESADGPWVDELKYVNVCADKPIYYQVTAEGYTTATGSANVTVTPKTLTNDAIWLVFPSEDYVYDGTAKEPEVAAYDGDPSIITDDDWEVSFADNVNAGTATATFTGKGNYTGTCTEAFEIAKADNSWTTAPAVADWTYGQTASTPVSAAQIGSATVTWSSGSVPTLPGSYTATFTVAESDNYNELTKTVNFKVLPATINLVADGASGEYCGVGYGITVNVSTPASGYTVKYAESTEGPWVDELKYVNVCADKPIYYQVTAEGYTTATGSANVTVTPKELTNDSIWLVLPAEDYVYDGTAKEPDVAAADGDPSIITDGDWEVSFTDNVNAGTATATFTGKGNYTGTCTEEFVILKADITGGGEEPGAGSVPAGGKSKFDATTEYDGQPHTIQTNELMTAFVDQCTGAGVAAPDAFQYSTDWNGSEGTWTEDVPTFVDVVTTSVWYKVCMADANYDDYVHEAQLTITPRNISNVTVDPIADQTETGAAIEPTLTVTDGDPSIVTANDYTAAYADNVAPGTATATLTGKGNYTGTKSVNFTILPSGPDKALLDASVAWTLLKATGTYFAQVTVTCTNGFDKGVSDLKFLFADRMDGSTVVASLWSTPQRAANPNTEVHDGVTYRVVTLPTAALTAENAPAVYGVSNLAATTIPVDERLIEMFVRKRVDPATGNESAAGVEDFVGYVAWTSNGETTMIPVVAGSAAKTLKKVSLMAAAPMSLGTINASLAVGVAVDETAKPYCRIVSFAANDEKISGFVEVGATLGDVQKAGTLGDNARMSLYGATSLTGPFEKIGSARGAFSFPNTKGFRFFKAGLEIDEIVK